MKPQEHVAHNWSHRILGLGSGTDCSPSPTSNSFAAWWKARAFLGIFQVVDSVMSLREQVESKRVQWFQPIVTSPFMPEARPLEQEV